VHRSLGRHLYHGVVALAKNPSIRVACAGNSSSGLKETPAFGCPAIDIGSRQEGRLSGRNVVRVGYNSKEIVLAIQRCLFDEDFRNLCRTAENPYWLGDAGPKIAKVLAEVALDYKLIRKKMTLKGDLKNGWFR